MLNIGHVSAVYVCGSRHYMWEHMQLQLVMQHLTLLGSKHVTQH